MRPLGLLILALLSVSGCAYKRITTPLHLDLDPKLGADDQPGYMYTFRVLSAVAAPTKISGLPWDDDGSGPDCFVRMFIDKTLVWTSEVKEDNAHPEWNAVLPRNVVIGPDTRLRLEIWDYDTAITADPVGHIEQKGLPTTALTDAMVRLQLDSLATLVMMVSDPHAHRGVGLSVEIRPDALKVIAVEPYSPAARAGIKVGDNITGIGNERVSQMKGDDAAGELSLAAQRSRKLVVAGADGKNEHDVTLDTGYVWLVM